MFVAAMGKWRDLLPRLQNYVMRSKLMKMNFVSLKKNSARGKSLTNQI